MRVLVRQWAANQSWIVQVVLLLTTASALALRLWELDKDEINGDEAFTFSYISGSYADIVRLTLESREPHPVGSYFVFKALLPLFGDSEFALRFPSVWSGVIAVALTYRLGCELRAFAGLSRLAAVMSAVVIAFAPFSVYHSREVRMYAMVLALTIAAACFALAAWRTGRTRDLLGYGLSSFAALHVHYYAAAVLLALNLAWVAHVLIQARQVGLRAALRSSLGWLAAQAALAVAYAPWAWVAREALLHYEGTAERFDPQSALIRVLSAMSAGDRAHALTAAFAGISAGVLVLGAAVLLVQRSGRALALLLLYFSLPIALAIVAALSRPIFRERYFIVSLAPFSLLAGSATAMVFCAGSASPTSVWRILGAAACAGMGWVTYEANRSYLADWHASLPSWRTVAQIAQQHHSDIAPERLFVVLNFPEPALGYYYRGPARVIVMPLHALDYQRALTQVNQMVQEGIARVVLQEMKAPSWDGDGIAAAALRSRFAELEARPVAEWTVRVWGRRDPAELCCLST
ncbi:MAG: glycosyltransferase family 39 protein [Thermoflexales bacterium]|nr:glycosyltransferase family 39 protein [Thermoflexales bacterium]